MSFLDIRGDQLILPDLTYDDFMTASLKVKPTVGEKDFK